MSELYTIILKSIRSVVIAAGAVGNIFSFVIFLRPVFKNNSISTYCQALAIADLFTLFFLAYDIQWLIDRSYLPDQIEAVCIFYYFIGLSMSAMPGWVLAAFSIDKLLNVRIGSIVIIKKKWFQLSVIAFCCFLNLIVNINILISLRLRPNGCFLSTMNNFFIYSIIVTIVNTILPFGIMIVTSILILIALRSSRLRIRHHTETNNIENQKKAREKKFALSSLTFNVLFVTLRMPLAVAYIFSGLGKYLGDEFQEISSLLYCGNSSITFLIHIASNSIFRMEVINFFKSTDSNVQKSSTNSIRVTNIIINGGNSNHKNNLK